MGISGKPFRSFFDNLHVFMEGAQSGGIDKTKSDTYKSHNSEIENALIVLSAEILKVNRVLDSNTEIYLKGFFKKQFDKPIEEILPKLNKYLEIGTEAYIRMSCTILRKLTDDASREYVVRYLFGLAAADSFITPREIKSIHRLSRLLHVNEATYLTVKTEHSIKHSPYALLGIDEDATMEQVKSAYRRLVLKYHPDKRTNGTSEAEASAKFIAIQKAYMQITGSVG